MPWVNVGTNSCPKGEYTSLGPLAYNRSWVVIVNNFPPYGVRLWGVAIGLNSLSFDGGSTFVNTVYFANRIYNQRSFFSAVTPAAGAGSALFWYTPENAVVAPNVTYWRLDP